MCSHEHTHTFEQLGKPGSTCRYPSCILSSLADLPSIPHTPLLGLTPQLCVGWSSTPWAQLGFSGDSCKKALACPLDSPLLPSPSPIINPHGAWDREVRIGAPQISLVHSWGESVETCDCLVNSGPVFERCRFLMVFVCATDCPVGI